MTIITQHIAIMSTAITKHKIDERDTTHFDSTQTAQLQNQTFN